MTEPIRVFVYGTLRTGGSNHQLLQGQCLLGVFTTEAAYRLYDFGDYPGAMMQGSTALVGEVYQIDADCLAELDALEETPWFYSRSLITTDWGEAWIYTLVQAPADAQLLRHGDWLQRASGI